MVQLREVEKQLAKIGAKFKFFGRSSVRELPHILVDNEQINSCLNGRYEGGFGLLTATDMRLLLIDKKPLYLTVEDIRYDMVVEVDYNHRLIDATIQVRTPNKTLSFTSFKQKELREMTMYIQQRVMELRQGHMLQNSAQTTASPSQEADVQQEPLSTPSLGTTSLTVGQNPYAVSQFSETAAPEPTLDLGEQLESSRLPEISVPRAVNPYITAPFISRRRVSRFHR